MRVLLAVMMVCAASAAAAPRIVVQGRNEATITTGSIRLSDIAEISSSDMRDDEAIIGLQRITITEAPLPGKTASIAAGQIIERLTKEGVNLKEVGYILPRTITVKRASRSVNESEIRAAIEHYMRQNGMDAVLERVVYPLGTQIGTGSVELIPVPLGTAHNGQMSFSIKVRSSHGDEGSFNAEANVEQWREVPVAKRTMAKGEVVGADDLMMARMNVARMPEYAADNEARIVGQKLSEPVSTGDLFHINKLAVPPVIEAGGRATLVYRFKGLEATAIGTALETGIAGQSIRVRNENSKKIITGIVHASGLVEVQP